MRELTLRVGAADLEEVLDSVLPALPGGAHLREAGGMVEVSVLEHPRGPTEEELRALAGPHLLALRTVGVSDDWRARRLARYEPLVIGGRFLVRPDWAPAGQAPGLTEVVLEQSSAFGTGLHPTTQACLATLAQLEPGGSFADLGCGSGVLSIAAAKLGWAPIVAVDVDEGSVAATGANAARNEVALEARQADLTAEQPPAAATIVANVPPAIHTAIAERLESAPAQVIASGFRGEEMAAVASRWSAAGLEVVDEVRANEWMVLVLR